MQARQSGGSGVERRSGGMDTWVALMIETLLTKITIRPGHKQDVLRLGLGPFP